LIEQNGKTILHKAFGWKDFAAKTLNDTLTKFPILSVTKSFTATVLLKLQEQGLLSINDPLGKYFPDYPEGGKITLEQLITHSSGIYNYTDNIDEADSAVVCHPVSKAFVVEQFKNKPLAFKPGKVSATIIQDTTWLGW
jgi:CubicO group peptidase (beta-lactamase class C family)